jgi:hypothetical protein
MTTISYFRPAVLGPSPERLRVPIPECSEAPVFVIEGTASDITTRSVRKKSRDCTQYMRVGTMELNLTHEHERGWPIALRLQEGACYRAEVYECKARVKTSTELPLDAKTEDGLVFYSLARARLDSRDEADQRRVLKGYIGIWTDGLMVTTSNTDAATALKPGIAYKVIVRQLSPAS